MRRLRHTLSTFLFVALSATAALAGPFQVDIQGLGALPDGTFAGSSQQLSDAFDFGYGFRGGVMFGLNDFVYVGGNAGWYRAAAGKLFPDLGLDLDSIPVHGLVQVRAQKVIGLFAQAGAGFTHQKVSGDSSLLDGSQTSFSWLVGGGLSFGLPGPVALTLGADYTTIQHGDGDLWASDDSVHFWLFSAGIRIHTD